MAFTSPHWPLHALPEDIAKYKGKFLAGWDKIRASRLAKQKALGILPADATLSPRDPHVPEWSSLTDAEKQDWDDKMAVYAAMVDRMDQNIGKIRAKLKELGEDKNTVIMFLSDNGGSSESIKGNGFTPEVLEASKKPSSDPTSFTAYGFLGANVSNTPFRLFKHWEYEGGTATPFIVSYPAGIKQHHVDNRPAHIVDLMSTCLDLAHTAYPKTYNGNTIKPTEGISLVPVIEGKTWKGHNALFFEHEGNRAIRQGDWKLVSEFAKNKWELYNVKTDRSEMNDLAAKYPERVKAMEALYLAWAKHAEVIPFETFEKRKGDDF